MAARSSSFGIFIALLVLAHLVLHVALGYGGVVPDFITIAVLLAARRSSPPAAAALGLVLGLLADAFAVGAFGATAVALVVVAWLGARTRDLFEGGSYLFVGFYLFVGKWLADILHLLLTRGLQRGELGSLLTAAPLEALFTALAGILALAAYRSVVGERRGR